MYTVRAELSLLHETILREDILATSVAWEICSKRGKKFQGYSHGVFEGENGLLQVQADNSLQTSKHPLPNFLVFSRCHFNLRTFIIQKMYQVK